MTQMIKAYINVDEKKQKDHDLARAYVWNRGLYCFLS